MGCKSFEDFSVCSQREHKQRKTKRHFASTCKLPVPNPYKPNGFPNFFPQITCARCRTRLLGKTAHTQYRTARGGAAHVRSSSWRRPRPPGLPLQPQQRQGPPTAAGAGSPRPPRAEAPSRSPHDGSGCPSVGSSAAQLGPSARSARHTDQPLSETSRRRGQR